MNREREYDDYLPGSPKTPTAGAWWALMEDEPFDEKKLGISPLSEGGRTRSQWSEGFWNLLLAESPSDELEAASCAKESSSLDRDASEISKQAHYLRNEIQHKKHRSATPKQQSNDKSRKDASELLLDMLQCGNLSNLGATSYSKIEATLADRLEDVNSGCKLLRKPNNSCDEYDDEIFEIQTDSVESFTIHYTMPNTSEDDIFIELQDEIPFLRERGEVQNASSKYKDILGATASLDAMERNQKEKETRAASLLKHLEEAEEVHQRRKFPVESKLDEPKNYRNRVPLTSTPTDGNLLKEVEIPSRKLHESPRTFKAAYISDTAITTRELENVPPAEVAHADIESEKGNTTTTDIPRDVDSETMDDIIKKISTLTSEGDFNTALYMHRDVLPTADSPRMCVPPIFMKQMATLKNNIKISKSLSSSQSVKSSTVHALRNIATTDNSSNGDGYIYDYDSSIHAYIAYFRRGSKAVDAIQLYEQPVPVAFATLDQEVVVRIEVSTVSGTDVQVRRGDFWGENSPQPLNLPIVPGVSFCGIVSQISQSSHKTGLSIGDRVISLVQVGANSRHLCVNSKFLVKVPDDIKEPHSVACLPEIYLTAFQALHLGQKNGARYRKSSLAGKNILVLGGGSTLGQALIQVAVAAGCETVYATEKEKHFDAISKAGGAPLSKDYKHWCSILVRKIHIIVAIDNSIGNSELMQDHVDLLVRNGRVILLCRPGLNNKSAIDLDKQPDISKSGRVLYRYNVFDSWGDDLKQGKRDLTHLLKLFSDGAIRPHIIEQLPLFRVAKAQDLMEGKKLSGFILCEPWMRGKKKTEGPDLDVFVESASKSSEVDTSDGRHATKVVANIQGHDMHDEVIHMSASEITNRTRTSPSKKVYATIPRVPGILDPHSNFREAAFVRTQQGSTQATRAAGYNVPSDPKLSPEEMEI